ncbi:MAG: RdgB/HAM1 family non-canonical purine NTP pyrophosphatase [Oscillospiraceae bacterium]
MEWIIATNNTGKLAEFARILEALGIRAVSQREAGVRLEVEETGKTFEENAYLKAAAAAKASGRPAVADDSGLEVDALGGAPGVYTARYAGENATDEQNIGKLLAALGDLPADRRGARFVSAICCVLPDGGSFTVRGECEGRIGFERAGTGGFGYDPVFFVGGRSFAQLSAAEKDACSHRGKALRAFAARLREQDGFEMPRIE